MGSILPIGRLLRTPRVPTSSYTANPAQPAAAPVAATAPAATTNTNSTPEPSVLSQRERNLEARNSGAAGLIGTSLRGLLDFAGKLPQRKTLLGE